MATNEQTADQIIVTGSHGQFNWLTSSEQYIGTLLQLCADVVVGRFLAVTSYDSGVPALTPRQRANGWQLRSDIAYSPKITSVEDLLYQRDGDDSPGFDEWYCFDALPPELGEIISGNPFEEANAPQPGRLMVFVNHFAFVIHNPEPMAQPLIANFWRQMEWIQPAVYIADGMDNLTCVCKNRPLFDSVCERLRSALVK